MLRLTVLLLTFAGSVNAATYTFEEENGTFIDSEYGGRDDVYDLYQAELAYNQLVFDDCEADPENYGVSDCTQFLTRFEQYRARGNYGNFEDYYAAHLQHAIDRLDISGWETEGLAVKATSYFFFPYGSQPGSYLGTLETFGDGVGPRGVEMTLGEGQSLVSIDLSMGQPGYSDAIIIRAGSILHTLDSSFDGTFYFGSEFSDISKFSIGAGIGSYETNIYGFSYGNLVTQSTTIGPEPSSVPLPAPIALLSFGLVGLGTLRSFRNRRPRNA